MMSQGEGAGPTLDNLRTTSLLPLPTALDRRLHRRPRSASSCNRTQAERRGLNCRGGWGFKLTSDQLHHHTPPSWPTSPASLHTCGSPHQPTCALYHEGRWVWILVYLGSLMCDTKIQTELNFMIQTAGLHVVQSDSQTDKNIIGPHIKQPWFCVQHLLSGKSE